MSFKKSFNSLDIESEEMAVLLLGHKNRVLSETFMDFVSRRSIHRIEITTEKELLILDVLKNRLLFENGTTKKQIYHENYNLNDMFLDEIKHFLSCVKRMSEPLQNLEMAKRVLDILLKNGESKKIF